MENNDERVYCINCQAFEPMKEQKSKASRIGTCHLGPPVCLTSEKVARWPIVLEAYGYCYSGVPKNEK